MTTTSATGLSWRYGLSRQLIAAGQALLDLLYPPSCPGCGRVGALLCDACRSQIEPAPVPACLRCGRPAEAEVLCPNCRTVPSHLERIASSAIHARPLREAIHSFKYNNGRGLAEPLGAYMATVWQQHGFTADLIVPVPLHTGRLAERGYNQSALLAHALGNAVGVRVSEAVLMRHKATRHQVGLGRVERKQNVAGAFVCRGDVAGRRIALIDDVCTTGSTLEACAEALRAGGAISVWAFTLARARWAPAQGDAVPDLG